MLKVLEKEAHKMTEAFGFMREWPQAATYSVSYKINGIEKQYMARTYYNGIETPEGEKIPLDVRYAEPENAIRDTLDCLKRLAEEYHIIVRKLPEMQIKPPTELGLTQYIIRMRLILIPKDEWARIEAAESQKPEEKQEETPPQDDMGKVLPLFTNTTDPLLFLKQIVTDAENYENARPLGVVVVMKCADGEWRTGYIGMNFVERLQAISRLQLDLVDKMILTNAERYGLHSHE